MHSFKLRKMKAELTESGDVLYFLGDEEKHLPLNELIGMKLKMEYLGSINCLHCDKKTKKSYGQGHCYPCFIKLASCDMCMVKPETCHYHKGTCREPQWGESHCLIPHTVYLANSSGLKVGITRGTRPTNRWIDQGAITGIPIIRTNSRLAAGIVESELKKYVADKTNWRSMLKGNIPLLDLALERDRLLSSVATDLPGEISTLEELHLRYPIMLHPTKIKSYNLDKTPQVDGLLHGIKGQYLIFDSGVINIRKHSGYNITLSIHSP